MKDFIIIQSCVWHLRPFIILFISHWLMKMLWSTTSNLSVEPGFVFIYRFITLNFFRNQRTSYFSGATISWTCDYFIYSCCTLSFNASDSGNVFCTVRMCAFVFIDTTLLFSYLLFFLKRYSWHFEEYYFASNSDGKN